MSDDYTDEHDDDEVDESPVLKKVRKGYEESNRKNRELEAELATLRRESAFRAAGIDPTDPKARYFVKGYEGELQADAIKAEAQDAGILGDTPPSTPDAEMRAHQQQAEITAGAEAPAHLDGNAEYEADLAQAVTKDEILAVMSKHGSPFVSALD